MLNCSERVCGSLFVHISNRPPSLQGVPMVYCLVMLGQGSLCTYEDQRCRMHGPRSGSYRIYLNQRCYIDNEQKESKPTGGAEGFRYLPFPSHLRNIPCRHGPSMKLLACRISPRRPVCERMSLHNRFLRQSCTNRPS